MFRQQGQAPIMADPAAWLACFPGKNPDLSKDRNILPDVIGLM